MKRPFPFFPILFAAFPVVALYSMNLAMVPLADVARPLAVSIGISAFAWALFGLITRSLGKGALLATVLLALFFSYSSGAKALGEIVVQIVDVCILGGLLFLLLRTKRDLQRWASTLNFGSAVLIILPIAQVLVKRPPGAEQTFLKVDLPVHANPQTVVAKPDIFFIIVDGYGRADQLKRVMGYSNDAFVQELRNRGFYVEDKARSTYCQTQLSLASTLNLSLLQDFRRVFPETSDQREALIKGMGHSFAASYLKSLGYTYVTLTSGFDEVRFEDADLTYDKPLSLTMLESTLIQLTPLNVHGYQIENLYSQRVKSLEGAIRNLAVLATPTGRPRFIVAHILAPHPPFVFDANGNATRQQHVGFGFWDGSHFMMVGGTKQQYTEGYTGQVQWLNRQLLSIIDQVQAKARIQPVILIEGDHGSKLNLDQESLARTDVRECFSNLMALYVPESVRPKLYPEMTSVNTFRLLFDGLFGENLPLLPDRSYYSAFSLPYKFYDVTDQVK